MILRLLIAIVLINLKLTTVFITIVAGYASNGHANCPVSFYLSNHNNVFTANNDSTHVYNYPNIYFNNSLIHDEKDKYHHGMDMDCTTIPSTSFL